MLLEKHWMDEYLIEAVRGILEVWDYISFGNANIVT